MRLGPRGRGRLPRRGAKGGAGASVLTVRPISERSLIPRRPGEDAPVARRTDTPGIRSATGGRRTPRTPLKRGRPSPRESSRRHQHSRRPKTTANQPGKFAAGPSAIRHAAIMITTAAMRLHAISHLHPAFPSFRDERQGCVASNVRRVGACDSDPFQPNLAIWRKEPSRASFLPPKASVLGNFTPL